jgi:hypothetical protein
MQSYARSNDVSPGFFQQEDDAMRTLALIGLLAAALTTAGCFGTPAYSPSERNDMIFRNYNYEGGQMVDEFDTDVLMARPVSHMTYWNVQ